MEMQHMGAATTAPWPGSDLGKWTDILASACDAIAGASSSLMKSVTVTGRLDGAEGEARLIMLLSKQLAAERYLQATFKLEGHGFSVQFSRPDSGSDGRLQH